jgi:hypothetical protein
MGIHVVRASCCVKGFLLHSKGVAIIMWITSNLNYLQGMCMTSCMHNKFHELLKQQIGPRTISCYNSYACMIIAFNFITTFGCDFAFPICAFYHRCAFGSYLSWV